jgi:hypothetical protein
LKYGSPNQLALSIKPKLIITNYKLIHKFDVEHPKIAKWQFGKDE